MTQRRIRGFTGFGDGANQDHHSTLLGQVKRALSPTPEHIFDMYPIGSGAVTTLADTFTVLTTEANEVVREFHDRMPVILDPATYVVWLNPSATSRQLLDVAAAAPDELLEAVEVNQIVNATSFDGPECLDPPSPPIELDLFG